MIRGIVIQMTTAELVKHMHAKADWYDNRSKSMPEGEREKWAYDATLFRFMAAHLPANETFELTLEEIRVWVHFSPKDEAQKSDLQ